MAKKKDTTPKTVEKSSSLDFMTEVAKSLNGKGVEVDRLAEQEIDLGKVLEKTAYPKKEDFNKQDVNATRIDDIISLSEGEGKTAGEVHKFMDPKVLESYRRTPKVNNKILIQVRHKDFSLTNHETMVDLCYFDQNQRKIVQKNTIPLFYKSHYKGLFGREDLIFYCNISDLNDIKEMLKADRNKVKKTEDALADFLKEI